VRIPTVIDADGLASIAGHLDLLKSARAPLLLTPHPGEMARLTGSCVAAVQAGRKKVAKDFSLRYNVTLILKGHRTLVASPHRPLYVNDTGNPGMATAGSGDVLAGMIAAFLAQGLPPDEAGRTAVYLHGLAGDLAARDLGPVSLMASDIIRHLPQAFKRSGL
jgi:NAD(P)H-hydrate epimerase